MALVVRRDSSIGSELYCYNTEVDRNSVVSQVSWRMDVINETSKFTHDEVGVIRSIPHRWQRTVDALGDYFEGLEYVRVRYF